MPTFTKQILKPGRYVVLGLDGRRREERISRQRIAHWVKLFNSMRKRGIRVPAPWGHRLDVVAGTIDDGPDKPLSSLSDPRYNAGFWEELWQDNDGTLYGKLNVPRQEDADRIGTSIREVSPLVKPSWVDGLGNSYNDVLLHIALCTNPVIPGQTNFSPDTGGTSPVAETAGSRVDGASGGEGMALSLSGWMGADDPGSTSSNEVRSEPSAPSLAEALSCLKKLGLELPEDTNESNFIERLCVAARAVLSSKEEKEVRSPGTTDGSKQEPTPLVMSAQDDKASASAYIAYASKLARQAYESRLNALKKRGVLTDEYRAKHIDPLLNGFQLSLSKDGTPSHTALDTIISALESIPSPRLLEPAKSVSAWKASHSVGDPPDLNPGDRPLDPDDPDDEARIIEIVEQQLISSGYMRRVPSNHQATTRVQKRYE